MLRLRLCPRCGCSHGSKEGQPFTVTYVCQVCQAEIRDAHAPPPSPARPKPQPKAPKRKRGKP